MGPVMWWCAIPRAEGKWIAGPDGPLAPGPGGATWAAGILTLTHAAFRHLEHLGTLAAQPEGRITWSGPGVPVLHAGGAAYEVVPAGGEETLTERPGGGRGAR